MNYLYDFSGNLVIRRPARLSQITGQPGIKLSRRAIL